MTIVLGQPLIGQGFELYTQGIYDILKFKGEVIRKFPGSLYTVNAIKRYAQLWARRACSS